MGDTFAEILRPRAIKLKIFIAIPAGNRVGTCYQVNQAYEAAGQLRAEFPNQRLEVIDSLCSSSGYGLLVDGAADLRDAGKSMDETIDWVMAWRKRVHHQFYSTDLKYFRRSGRVSGPAVTVGAILGICPIMRLDDRGRIIAYDKVRGENKKQETARDPKRIGAVSCLHAKQNGLL